MIYLLYGKDTDKARAKLRALIQSLIQKKPDAAHVKITDETFTPTALSEALGGIGLFTSKIIVEMDMVFRNKEAKELVLNELKEIAASESIFVFLEGDLTKTDLTKFEKYAEKVQEFAVKTPVQKPKDFNVFALTDALGKRNKKELWVLYQKALRAGKEPEEIHGILLWQLKAMILAASAESPQDAGLNPFVYQKSKQFGKMFGNENVQQALTDFVSLYHESRRGGKELSYALEEFILGL